MMRETFNSRWFAGRWKETPIALYALALESSDGGTDYEGQVLLLGPANFSKMETLIEDEVVRFRKGFQKWSDREKREQAEDDAFPKADLCEMTAEQQEEWHKWLRTWRHDNPLPAYPAERVADRLESEFDFIRLETRLFSIDYSEDRHAKIKGTE
jgi:hypothetical protein